MIAKSVFDALGAQTFVINNQPDGTNINRDCGSTHIRHLQKLGWWWMRAGRALPLMGTRTAAWRWMQAMWSTVT